MVTKKKASRKASSAKSTSCPYCGARQGVVSFSQICYKCGHTFFP